MAKTFWLLTMLACACSGGSTPAPAGWLTVTLSQPTGGRHCSAAAPTPYDFGSETGPLRGQVGCTIHSSENDSWVSGQLAESRTSAGGDNVGFDINTQQGLSLVFVSDATGTLKLDPSAEGDCDPTGTFTFGNAASIDFGCPLLVDPNDSTSGCGMRGTVNFENCATK